MKRKWTCPNCQAILGKREDSGESVKYCFNCGSSWFMLLCVRPDSDSISRSDFVERATKAGESVFFV